MTTSAELRAIEKHAEKLTSALQEHTDALVRSAEASNRYSKHLMYATYALVAATIFLGCTSVLLMIINAMQFLEGV
jgi:hypothetical protein